QSFGDLLFSTNRVEKAQQYYQKALLLYHSEQEPMGLAYTSAELIRCNHRLDSLKQDELEKLAAEALIMAERSGVRSVSQYVLTALYEAFDEDEGRLKDLLKKIGVKV
ncbi:hypothetical protein, partial [Desulfosarcina cetonica]|uniref:hypothetical protein n=1 Tax=Desulfosarcina cetonica TaxID=90730 RepID=UPI00155D8C5D